jgi:PAS domain S-box-containing protein
LSEPTGPSQPREITGELIEALVRLARADFTVRLRRNFKRDTDDTLAFFVNLIAEELDRLLTEREQKRKELEDGVNTLSELFLKVAAGEFTVRAARSGKGDPLDVLAFLFNNTVAEVGDAFAELDRQRQVLQAILESMIDGVLLLDAAGNVLRANAAAAQLLGYEPATLESRRIEELLAAKERTFAERLTEVVKQGAFRDRATLFLSAKGEVMTLSVNGSPQRSSDGELVGIVLLARDDRELKQAQAQLQLTDRLATMGTLAAGVAHEINNPLAFVIGNLDFIAEELEALGQSAFDAERLAEMKRALSSSQGGAERVRQIVKDLKSFARVDQDVVKPLDLNKLVETALGMTRNEIRHHAKLTKELGVVPTVVANEARLVQVLINLLQNAAQAIPAGKVEQNEICVVTGRHEGGAARIAVRDTGKGIGEDTLPRIFDAFFTTKPVGVGTGLGLSISHKIVSSLGGRIEVESELGRGTTFSVILPGVENATPRPSIAPPGRDATLGERKRILVIDDEQEVCDTLERMLGRDHDVVTETRAASALERMSQDAFDLVLVDLMMPEMNGVEFYDRLLATSAAQAERVVFMSAGSFDAKTRELLERIPNRLIDKPFDSTILRQIVQSE